ncbi:type II toxin-antitoxin system RelE/ParE family toxin [Bosea caraganae]|uniref:Type II toxin-antitoxin system RelE/ParE family toxin n=1 Tax=Bosea caraganae TaxID=2763117 RepID=A0A370L7L9_9HYPH|nr:type II toxin-antitoxin system RelE/ParE family toxin [Bosea caraganae]RDJ24933.1 type II toxin-antitoxin system RelE/ParE family toxin [Bosea caraganae]RDJ26045.1 type II toxin-antitoxin system RelE/ParE family toxin [Bosea caraganae]
MRQLRYANAVRRDLVAITRFIRKGSGNRAVAEAFARSVQDQCQQLARLPGELGRPRPDLRPDMRSFAFKGYVIFFRYAGDAVEIVRVIERHRDATAQFDDDKS